MLQAQQLLEANFISSPNETISNRITVANGKLKNRARGEKNDQNLNVITKFRETDS